MQSRLPAKSRLATFAAAGALALLAANPASAAEKIGVSMPNIKGPWFTPVLYGISDEAKKLGYDVTIQDAGGYANVDKQVSQFSNLVVQKVAAILIDPANPASFNGAVKEAKADKIPVIGAGSPIVASDVEADAAASSSHCNIGHELAKGAKTYCRTAVPSLCLPDRPEHSGRPTASAASRKILPAAISRSSLNKRASRTLQLRFRWPVTSCSGFPRSICCMAPMIHTELARRAQHKGRKNAAR